MSGMATFHKRKSGGHYARLMGTLWRHLKTVEAGDAALGMWTRMLSYCADTGRTVISRRELQTLMAGDKNGPRKLAALVAARLVDEVDGGVSPHDWFDHNPGLKPSNAPTNDNAQESNDGRNVTANVRDREESMRDREENVTRNVTRNVSKPPEQNRELRPPLSRPKTQDIRSPSGEGESARERPWPDEREFTAERQALVFQAEFERTAHTVPSMGGRHVGSFHAAVRRTAELQARNPEELFREVLARWLSQPLSDVARRSPYACFCQAWGELTNASPAAAPEPSEPSTESVDALLEQAKALSIAKDWDGATALYGRAKQLREELEKQEGRRAFRSVR